MKKIKLLFVGDLDLEIDSTENHMEFKKTADVTMPKTWPDKEQQSTDAEKKVTVKGMYGTPDKEETLGERLIAMKHDGSELDTVKRPFANLIDRIDSMKLEEEENEFVGQAVASLVNACEYLEKAIAATKK